MSGSRLPLLVLRDRVLFPGDAIEVSLVREASFRTLETCLRSEEQPIRILVALQRDPAEEDPREEDLHVRATLAEIGAVRGEDRHDCALALRGRARVDIESFGLSKDGWSAGWQPIEGQGVATEDAGEVLEQLRVGGAALVREGAPLPPGAQEHMAACTDPSVLGDLLAGQIPLKADEAHRILAEDDARSRIDRILSAMEAWRADLVDRARYEQERAAVDASRLPAVLAESEDEARHALDALQPSDRRLFEAFRDDGFFVIEGLVEHEKIDALLADIEAVRQSPDRFLVTDHRRHRPFRHAWPGFDDYESLFDLYVNLESSRAVCLHPEIVRLLRLLFGARPVAFQQLLFQRSNGHPLHQDTAYVDVEAPRMLAATWVALEDVVPGRGELVYYPGSHRLRRTFSDGSPRFQAGHDDPAAYEEWIRSSLESIGSEERSFLARKGDVFFWAADLVHGSKERTRPVHETRRSCVTHYCAEDVREGWFARRPHCRERWEVAGGSALVASARYELGQGRGLLRPVPPRNLPI